LLVGTLPTNNKSVASPLTGSVPINPIKLYRLSVHEGIASPLGQAQFKYIVPLGVAIRVCPLGQTLP
jgi:hypothetical protein